jgi:hypothetical protein
VQSLVQLYRALGGGWTALEPPAEYGSGEGGGDDGNGNAPADEVGDAKQG